MVSNKKNQPIHLLCNFLDKWYSYVIGVYMMYLRIGNTFHDIINNNNKIIIS